MRTEQEMEQIKVIKNKLKECKPEWLEKNQKNQDALGVSTVQQILDYATDGLWSFDIQEQWREEVSKFNKQSGQWIFDGYVYHVRAVLFIDGMGRRAQYGSKVAIGGKDNQNSSYKSAASDCLKKCASLFGVGSSIYSKIKVETEDADQQYNQLQENTQYAVGQQPQQPQVQQQVQQPTQDQQFTLPNGDIQQGEYIWTNNGWVHQTQYQPLQPAGQYPRLTPEQEKTQWYHDTMQQNDPKGYDRMVQQTGISPLDQQAQEINATLQAADQAVLNPHVDYPFENVPAKQEQAQEQSQVQENSFEAQPQAEAKAQEYVAVQHGAPVATEPQAIKETVDPLANVQAENPWNTQENMQELQLFQSHKDRLFVKKDNDLLPHVREFFKDGSAEINSITPDTLKGFNMYLQNIQV